METKRIPLPSILATRDASVTKDGLLTNCYSEQGPDGVEKIVKRPGMSLRANIGAADCPGQGAFFFLGGPVFIACDTLTVGIPGPIPPPPCTLGINPIITGVASGSDYFLTPNGHGELAYYGRLGSSLVWIKRITPTGVQHVSLVEMVSKTIVQDFPQSMFPGSVPDLTIRGVDQFDGSAYILNYVSPEPTNRIYKLRTSGSIEGYLKPPVDMGIHGVHGDVSGTTLWMNNFLGHKVVRAVGIDWSAHTLAINTSTGAANEVLDFFLFNPVNVPGRVYYHDGVSRNIAWVNTATMASTSILAGTMNTPAVMGADQNIYTSSQVISPPSTTLRKFDKDGGPLGTLFIDGNLYVPSLYDSNGFVWLHGSALGSGLPLLKVRATTLAIEAVVPTDPAAVSPNSYFSIVAEPINGKPAVYLNSDPTGQPGGIGLIDCVT